MVFFLSAFSLSCFLAFVFPQLYLFKRVISNVNTKKLHPDIRYILTSLPYDFSVRSLESLFLTCNDKLVFVHCTELCRTACSVSDMPMMRSFLRVDWNQTVGWLNCILTLFPRPILVREQEICPPCHQEDLVMGYICGYSRSHHQELFSLHPQVGTPPSEDKGCLHLVCKRDLVLVGWCTCADSLCSWSLCSSGENCVPSR